VGNQPILNDAAAAGPSKRIGMDHNWDSTLFPEDDIDGDEEEDNDEEPTKTTAGGRRASKRRAAATGKAAAVPPPPPSPPSPSGSKKTKKARKDDAAKVKASRERERRDRINNYFETLAKLCDHSGEPARTDRISVLVDAIRVVQQLRVENNQLKQLNKFLEEKVGSYERSRAQMTYQRAMQAQPPVNMPPAAPAASAVRSPSSQPQQQQQQTAEVVQMVMVTSGPLAGQLVALKHNEMATVTAVTAAAPASAVIDPTTIGAAIVGTDLPMVAATTNTNGGTRHGDGDGGGSWLPAPDPSEDQKLRPPAA
jgi:hypothetical protein